MSVNPENFWSKVEKGEGCWNWTAAKDTSGYGKFANWPLGFERSHRISWSLHHGPVPQGMCVLHRCDNRLCVNPDHLFIGTRDDNNKDRMRKGRGGSASGVRNGNSKLNPIQVDEIRLHYALGATFRELATKYQIDWKTAKQIALRQIWKGVA